MTTRLAVRVFVAVLIFSVVLSRAQAQQPLQPITDAELSAALSRTGSTGQKRLAVARATQLPPGSLSENTVGALARELQLLVAAQEKLMMAPTDSQLASSQDERSEGSDYE